MSQEKKGENWGRSRSRTSGHSYGKNYDGQARTHSWSSSRTTSNDIPENAENKVMSKGVSESVRVKDGFEITTYTQTVSTSYEIRKPTDKS